MDVMTHTISKRRHTLSLHNSYNLTMNNKLYHFIIKKIKKTMDIEFSVYSTFL
jgi:hypothetical protein